MPDTIVPATPAPEKVAIAPASFTPPVPKQETHQRGRPVPTTEEPPESILKMEFKMDDDLLSSDRSMTRIEEPTVINTNASETPPLKAPDKKVDSEQKKDDVVQPKATTTKQAEVPKEEKKRSPLDVLKMPEKKIEDQKTEVLSKDHEARDYSIFDAEEQVAAKQMSNTAFQQFTKLKKASKSDQIFYQHPEAYTTHPQYKEAVLNVQYGEQEHAFWQQQLLNCKEGKAVKNLTGYDTKGNPIFGTDVPASPIVEEQIRNLMYNTQQNTNKARADIQGIQTKFKAEFSTVRSRFDAERSTRFAWAQNPEVLNATLDLTDEQGNKHTKTVKQIKDDFKSLFPSYLVNDMGVEVASDLMVALQMMKQFHATQETKEIVKQTIEHEEKLVEPSSGAKPAKKGDAFGGITEFSASGMPQMI